MAINKLVAGAKGDAGNSTGADVAETVNGLIDHSYTSKGNIPKSFNDCLFVFCGDSTTEQAAGNGGMFDRLVNFYAKNGQIFDGAKGFVNYGSSGQTLVDFLSRVTPSFVGASEGDANWNYEGVKTTTSAVGLDDAISTDGDIYVVCYGINDLILNSSVGNLSEDSIVDYLYPKLIEAVTRIKAAKPNAGVILRSPNAMTARPVNPSFPSSTEYPDFGNDLSADQSLMSKFNSALKRSYAVASQILGDSVLLYDTIRYGIYDRGVTVSATEREELNDLVHPSLGTRRGYQAIADGLVSVLDSSQPVRGPVNIADRQEEVDATPAYSIYPEYMKDKQGLYSKLIKVSYYNAGSTFIDLGIDIDKFNQLVKSGAIYINAGNLGTQKYTSYNASASGSNTRLTGLSPAVPTEFQVNNLEASVYQDLGSRPVQIGASPLSSLRFLYSFDYKSKLVSSIFLHTGIAVPTTVNVEVFNIRSNTRTSLGTGLVGANGFTGTVNITPTTFAVGDVLDVSVTSPASYTGDAILRVNII